MNWKMNESNESALMDSSLLPPTPTPPPLPNAPWDTPLITSRRRMERELSYGNVIDPKANDRIVYSRSQHSDKINRPSSTTTSRYATSNRLSKDDNDFGSSSNDPSETMNAFSDRENTSTASGSSNGGRKNTFDGQQTVNQHVNIDKNGADGIEPNHAVSIKTNKAAASDNDNDDWDEMANDDVKKSKYDLKTISATAAQQNNSSSLFPTRLFSTANSNDRPAAQSECGQFNKRSNGQSISGNCAIDAMNIELLRFTPKWKFSTPKPLSR